MASRRSGANLLLTLFAMLLSCAQEPAKEPPRPESEQATGTTARLETETTPLFWRAQGSSGQTLYLLGSVHMGPPLGWRYPKEIGRAFEASNELIVEVDPSLVTQGEQQQLMMQYAMLPPWETLREKVSADTWSLVVEQAQQNDLDIATLERMKPWMVSNLLVLNAAAGLGYSPLVGVDQDFLTRAGERRVVPLETVEFQMSLLSNMSDELQELTLRDTLDRALEIHGFLATMLEAWRVGDEAALTDILFESLVQDAAFEPFYERVIFARNERMALRLAEVLEADGRAGETSFAVLGAGHLIGERSICAKLVEWGYRVERIGERTAIPHETKGAEIGVDR
jgi:uncharacterized protein YbaP (TraB family)